MPQARSSAGLTRSALIQTSLRWTKGGCYSLCTRGTRPRSRTTRLAASPTLPSSPAPPVSRHQTLPVQRGLRPPARRRHFQLFPGCTRTTHKTNKRPAAPAPASLPQPPSHPRRACAQPRPAPAGPTHAGTCASAQCWLRLAQPNGKRGNRRRNGKGREKSKVSPTRGSDWLWIPAETAAPSPGSSVPSCSNYQEPKGAELPLLTLFALNFQGQGAGKTESTRRRSSPRLGPLAVALILP